MAFDNLKTDKSIQGEKDTLGGTQLLDTGLYPMEVEVAYMGTSSGGAMSLNLHLKGKDDKSLRTAIYVTSGNVKGNKNTYTDKKGDKQYLPGFTLGNSLCLLTVGDEISSMDTEEKVIKLYNFDQKKELPTKVSMLTALLGKSIIVGVQKEIVDKNVKDANGNYVPSGDTRETNEVAKFFRAKDGLTVPEISAGVTESLFMDEWDKRFSGKVRNRSKGASSDAVAGAPKATKTPKESLFGK